MKDLEDQPVEDADIGFQADTSKLRRVIHSYGRVEAVGHTMDNYPVPDSLCASLNELSLIGQASGSEVAIEFPPFDAVSSLTEWLAKRDAGMYAPFIQYIPIDKLLPILMFSIIYDSIII